MGAAHPHPSSELLGLEDWQRIAARFDLSSRHIAVAKGIFANHTRERIARDMNLSPHTVDMHTRKLYGRVGVRTRVELVLRLIVESRLLLAEDGKDHATRLTVDRPVRAGSKRELRRRLHQMSD